MLKRDLGKEKIGHLDRQLIDYGKMRAEQGAGPVPVGLRRSDPDQDKCIPTPYAGMEANGCEAGKAI